MLKTASTTSTARLARALTAALALWCVALLGGGLSSSGPAEAAETSNSAVVVMYHRFGDERYPSTNVTLEQLDAHIAELTSGKYNVVHLSEIVDKLARGEPLADRTVAITIDDAYKTIYSDGWPRFREAGLPFTVFVSTGPVDRGLEDIMSWDQLREMQAAGVEIGAHSVSHLHMPSADAERNRRELADSNARFEAEIGKVPTLFAYPYGEASLGVIEIVKDAGYAAAFGQHSGALSGADDRFYLPRFPLNEDYGDMGRFRTAVNALAIPTADITPENMALLPGGGIENPPAMGFTVTEDIGNLDSLTCFVSHEGAATIERLGESRIEVRASQPFPKGRTRLNCTLPARGENAGRWHWFGRQFVIPGG